MNEAPRVTATRLWPAPNTGFFLFLRPRGCFRLREFPTLPFWRSGLSADCHLRGFLTTHRPPPTTRFFVNLPQPEVIGLVTCLYIQGLFPHLALHPMGLD